jgi:hypothetical protein
LALLDPNPDSRYESTDLIESNPDPDPKHWFNIACICAAEADFETAQTLNKNLLKNRLSIRVKNFAPLNKPLNISLIKFFIPKRLYDVKIRKI